MPKKTEIRCSKCFITLKRLKQDKICEHLIVIIKEDGKTDNICPVCLGGW